MFKVFFLFCYFANTFLVMPICGFIKKRALFKNCLEVFFPHSYCLFQPKMFFYEEGPWDLQKQTKSFSEIKCNFQVKEIQKWSLWKRAQEVVNEQSTHFFHIQTLIIYSFNAKNKILIVCLQKLIFGWRKFK